MSGKMRHTWEDGACRGNIGRLRFEMAKPDERRVVITGMGLISPLGNDYSTFASALRNGQSGVTPLSKENGEDTVIGYGGAAREFSGHVDDFGDLDKDQKRAIRKGIKLMCREIQMGVAAAQLSLQHAGLSAGDYDPNRSGVVYGCDHILSTHEEFVDAIGACIKDDQAFSLSRWTERGMSQVTPLWLLKYLPNMPASHIAIYNDLRGPNNSLTYREASSNLALGEAYTTIRRGSAETMIAGATGCSMAMLKTLHIAVQYQIANGQHQASQAARPFDLERTGMVPGEGAGAIVLETLERAQARGAQIYGEIVGVGSSVAQTRTGAARSRLAMANAMRASLRSADFSIDDIGHVHAHGLGTRQMDIDESSAINDVFSARRQPVPVVAAKSYFGNLGASTGLIELMASIQAWESDRLFPVQNYETPDPDCQIAVVRDDKTPAGSCFLNLNCSPQGQASAALVRQFA